MIDHVSVAVRDLARSARFYERVLGEIGLARLVTRQNTVGFGKRYPEFWLNRRAAVAPAASDSGAHVCLRAPDAEAVRRFHAVAVANGASSDGEPGLRPEYNERYYAAFVRDPDGNRIEAVTFLSAAT